MATKYVCTDCGNANIQIRMWVNINTNEIIDDVDDKNECWCNQCENHTYFEAEDEQPLLKG